ncbi:uncharacterized protein LOC131018886 [Salvia miltiorrhiza]|uniref:uncharacterized protein LOC131018886 n=1 Tax=Salvia miltiorrhiza TaxID=226208 RepID=UPI0025ACBEE0|nr:uncharacterized protein LOC131018886 [Salvia miltiorrhiza]
MPRKRRQLETDHHQPPPARYISANMETKKSKEKSLLDGCEIGDASNKTENIECAPTSMDKGKRPFKRVKCMAKKLKPSELVGETTPESYTDRIHIINPKNVKCRRRGVKLAVETQKTGLHTSLKNRTTTATFHDKLGELNDAQKEAIRAIGFGRILELKVRQIPGKLAYWVLDKFNSASCELQVDDGRNLKVTEDDVYRVFGFPKGKELIVNFERTASNKMFEEWVSFFGVGGKEKIKIGAVLNEMVNSRDGGTWFKRHFMIAMAFSLIESTASGTVHPYIFRCLTNLHELSQWNWGEYVLRTLIDHKRSWLVDQTKVFPGPTLFLVLLYVDRFEMNRKPENRLFPIFMNWSTVGLRERQRRELEDGFFGGGSLCEPIQLPDDYMNVDQRPIENINHEGDTDIENSSLVCRIMKEAIDIAERMEKIRQLVQGATLAERQSKVFKKSVSAACKIIGVTINIDAPESSQNMDLDDHLFYDSNDSVDATSAEAIPSFEVT